MMEDKEKKVELTDLFLDHILKWKQDKLFGFQFINEYMQMAHDSSLLLERHYICWLHLCDDDDKIALTVLMKGVETNPESIRLWKLRLYYGIERSMPNEDVQQIFENGVAHLKEKALPLWNAFLRFTILEESAANLEPIQTINIFKKAMAQPEEISRPFKIKYLEWAIVHR